MVMHMPSDTDVDAAVKKAEEQEKEYNWLEAAKSYEQTLKFEPSNVFLATETWEKIGFCYSRASTQAESLDEFKRIRQLAVEAYRNAAQLLEKENGSKNEGKSTRCNAIAEYVSSWLASNPSEKRERLEKSCTLGTKSLKAFESVGDELGYGKMSTDLLLCLLERMYVAYDWKEMMDVSQEGVDCANKAITILSKLGNKSELLKAYFAGSRLSWYAANISEQEERRKEFVQKSLSYSEKALELSKEVNDPYWTAMSNWAAAFCTLLFTEKVELSLQYAEEMLKQGTIARDNYLKGVASYVLSFVANWMTLREPDPDKQKEGNKKIIKYGEDAIHYLQPVSQDFFIAETYMFYAESYSSLARDIEVGIEEKRDLLKQAVENGRKGLDHANSSGSPDAMISTHHALSKALHFYSNFETGKDEKVKSLEEALVHRKEYNKIAERVVPTNDWIRGVGKNYEALITLELARVETDKDKKRLLLESAVSDMEDCLSRCGKWVSSRPIPTLIVTEARFEDSFGEMLNELYSLNGEQKTLNKAIEVYEDAAKNFKRVNLPSRAAESYWKMARNQGRLGKHHMAAETFDDAFSMYKAAAQRIPHFADFYLDYATYMKAWSEIERAKLNHEHEEYADAMKHYERIANLLKPSKLWGYMASNFFAWTLLEQAEDLSRRESGSESAEAFKKAAELFQQAKEAFEEEIGKIQNIDEKGKATELVSASVRRKEYCLARVDVEEARINDRRGDYAQSAGQYESAANTLEKILETTEAEVDRKEIKPFACMCRAWQKMKTADVRNSSELYHEASEEFSKAKECSAKDRTTLLASGNSAFCIALEHGTRFEAAREKDDFLKAKQYLESAANYYLRAGFDNASLWANATGVLFDAYNYMIGAELEGDPEKKMKTYLLAEKCLERSAKLYETAQYIGKRDEVLRTLEKVKEKREFALSLGELLAAPTDASSTTALSAPGMSVEEPVGLLKFERAYIEANLIARQRELVVGEAFGLEFQLANLGKNAAFLIKIEEIVPEGFELVEKPEKCVFGDGVLNFKGRRMVPLETAEMKLSLKPKKKGTFTFRPKIHYMDEAGEHKYCELEQVTVSVKEMGIRGWLRGPG